MNCPKCQTENPETRKFCRECGAKLPLMCPQCGNENLPGDKFCGECGNSLTELKEAPAIDYSKPQSYTPKFLADKILTTRSSIEGERKLVTVLFADVANYTSIAEKFDPEDVHQIMDDCFKILLDEIHKLEGTINQFTGDGVMALFGAPVAHEDHAQRACHTALSIQKAIGKYGETIQNDFGVNFRMRVGLNSGPVIVGAIGDDLRMDYTAVGDTTNLASRMESMARPDTILVSRHTHRLVRNFFEFKSLDKIEVKGKKEPQEVFELIKVGEVETRIEASVAKGLTRFVGRKNSTATLKKALEEAEEGSGQVVGIVGEAGVGKSRLILEFKDLLPQNEYTYLEGRCLHYGGSMAYLPILDILRSYFDIKEGDREFVIKKKIEDRITQLDKNLKATLPPLQDLLSLKVEDKAYLRLEPKQKRDMSFEAIRDLLVRESQNKPLVLFVEDLHWIDKTSEEFLDFLIGWMVSAKILLILLYRPEYTHPWGSKSYYNRIGLGQLNTKSGAELVQAILEGGEVMPELRELILGRAGGNPLFVEELTQSLLENGSIQRRDHQYVLTGAASEIQVPVTIQGIIAARIDRMEDSLKRIMQVASVIGRDFAFRILQTITGMREELKPCLLNLQGMEFIYEKSLFPELEYIFKHALTQEVAYNSLLLKRRKEIHEKIGKAIEEIYTERLEEFYEMLAYHYSKSENPEKACEYLKLSGNKAARNYSNLEAFRFYKEAIDVLTKLPETEKNKREQIEVHLLLTLPMFTLGFPEGSLEILQEGERLSKELGDEKTFAHFMSLIGNYYALKGEDLLVKIQHLEDSFKKAEKTNDIELMAPIGQLLCTFYWWQGECFKIIDVASKAIALLDNTQRQSESFGRPYSPYAQLHAKYAVSMGMLGNFEEGKILLEKGLDFALKIKNLFSLALLELDYGTMQNIRGDGKNSIVHLQKCIKYCEEGQIVILQGPGWSRLGWGYCLLGEIETARKHMEKGLKIHSDAGLQYHLSLQYGLLSMVHLEAGDLKNAQPLAEEALKLSQKNHEKWVEGFVGILLGRIFGKAKKSQDDKAEKSILQGIKILKEFQLKPLYAQGYHFLGELYTNTGQQNKAMKNLKKAEGMFREMGMDYWLARRQETIERL